MTSVRHLLIDRKDLSSTRVEDGTLASLEIGESLVRIDRVAMTANNITYAAIAHLIPYFEFFPSTVDGFGRLPVWGSARWWSRGATTSQLARVSSASGHHRLTS